MIRRLLAWLNPRFTPCVFYNAGLCTTEVLLRDTAMVSVLFQSKGDGHSVDLLYDFDGELVGVRMWADVRKRVRRSGLAPIVEGLE